MKDTEEKTCVELKREILEIYFKMLEEREKEEEEEEESKKLVKK